MLHRPAKLPESSAERPDAKRQVCGEATRRDEACSDRVRLRHRIAAFDFAVRLQSMESEARESYLEWLHVSFDALGIGSQGALFPAEVLPSAYDGPAEA